MGFSACFVVHKVALPSSARPGAFLFHFESVALHGATLPGLCSGVYETQKMRGSLLELGRGLFPDLVTEMNLLALFGCFLPVVKDCRFCWSFQKNLATSKSQEHTFYGKL